MRNFRCVGRSLCIVCHGCFLMKGPSLAFYCLQVNLTFAKRNVGVRSPATDQAPLTQAWNSRMPRQLGDARTCQQANKQSLHEGFPAVLPLSGSSRKSKNLELERGQLPPPLTAKRNEKKKPESVSTHSGNTEGLAIVGPTKVTYPTSGKQAHVKGKGPFPRLSTQPPGGLSWLQRGVVLVRWRT